jgi:carbonic anhydrase
LDLTDFWSYDGSLTTPPCTEGIKWNVLRNVQPISKRQLKRFTDLWSGNQEYANGEGNIRDVQPLNGRKIFMSNKKQQSSIFEST